MGTTNQLVIDAQARATKIVIGVLLLGAAAGVGALVPRFGFMAGLGAFAFGIAGISVVVASIRSPARRGACPTCGSELRDVASDAEAVECSACHDYSRVLAGALSTTPDDYVAATSAYALELAPGAQPDFHALCVACGGPATAAHPREMRATAASLPGVATMKKVWSVDVPVCSNHAHVDSLGNPPGVTSFEGTLKISSYRAWKAARGPLAAPRA
jgi:hypothetical protein